jgi:hypothetical protein
MYLLIILVRMRCLGLYEATRKPVKRGMGKQREKEKESNERLLEVPLPLYDSPPSPS